MKRKDETVKWLEGEIRRIKNSAVRDSYTFKAGHAIDPVSLKQIGLLEKQLQEYLKSKENTAK